MTWLVDTSIAVWLLRKTRPDLTERFEGMPIGSCCLSVVCYFELLVGAEKGARRERELRDIHWLTMAMPVMPLTDDVGPAYAAIHADLERRGKIIGPLDLLIAAHALTLGATLVTGNESEFRRVTGLKVENWAIRKR
ncbi:MAG: PIN domain-containing protein [Bryobacteraceae bacterium]|nr:PIN domain-containing protein [Bryobacteraceae bacterium]